MYIEANRTWDPQLPLEMLKNVTKIGMTLFLWEWFCYCFVVNVRSNLKKYILEFLCFCNITIRYLKDTQWSLRQFL